MTLREYLNIAITTGSINRSISCIHTLYYPDIEEPRDIHKIYHSYTSAALELINLPHDSHITDSSGQGIKEIALTQYLDDDTGTEHTDVHGITGDDKSETCAIEWTDWIELIDLPVHSEKSLDITSIICHILYDITFNGYTRAQILSSIQELSDVIRDTEVDKKSNNIIPFKLDDI